jgi:hypothetical protein
MRTRLIIATLFNESSKKLISLVTHAWRKRVHNVLLRNNFSMSIMYFNNVQAQDKHEPDEIIINETDNYETKIK